MLLCQPLLVPGLVSEELSSEVEVVGRSLFVGIIFKIRLIISMGLLFAKAGRQVELGLSCPAAAFIQTGRERETSTEETELGSKHPNGRLCGHSV